MLTNILRKCTYSRGKQLALRQGFDCLSYNKMWDLVDECAQLLNLMGFRHNDIIALFAANSIELAILHLAIWQIGAVPYPVRGQQIETLGFIPKVTQVIKALILEKSRDNVELSNRLSHSYVHTSVLDKFNFSVYIKSSPVDNIYNDISNNEIIAWISSSGTTAQSKVVKLDLDGTLANIKANAESLGLCENDITLMCLPMSYSYGLIAQFLSHLYVGGEIVFPDNPHLIHTLPPIIQQEQITTMFTVPILLRSFLTVFQSDQVPESFFSSLRLLTIGGGFVDKFTLMQAMNFFKNSCITVTYGLSEAGPRVSTYHVRENQRHIGSVGKPLSNVSINIVDENKNILPYFTEGEIVVHSPSVMRGYVGQPNNAGFIPNELVYTGDWGYMSEDGFLYVLGRESESIYIAQHHLYANELKEVIYCHSSVLHVDVSRNSKAGGQSELVKSVVPKPGKIIEAYELHRICEEKFPFLHNKITIKISRKLRGSSIKE